MHVTMSDLLASGDDICTHVSLCISESIHLSAVELKQVSANFDAEGQAWATHG